MEKTLECIALCLGHIYLVVTFVFGVLYLKDAMSGDYIPAKRTMLMFILFPIGWLCLLAEVVWQWANKKDDEYGA